MKFTKATRKQATGTYRQGRIETSFSDLKAVFGEPHYKFTDSGDSYSKIDAQWVLEFDDGTIATIYNYKNGAAYLGDDGQPPEQITEWHIGGFDKQAAERVKTELNTVFF